MGWLSNLFGGGGEQSTVVSTTTTVEVKPEITNVVLNDDSRLQGLVSVLTEQGERSNVVALMQAKATVDAAAAQRSSSEASAAALTTGLTRAAIIGAAATIGAALWLQKKKAA